MSLYVDQLVSLQGDTMRAFFVRNRKKKVLAIGATATASDPGFVIPKAKRYARDLSLCVAISRLTGVPIKWNLRWNGKRYCS